MEAEVLGALVLASVKWVSKISAGGTETPFCGSQPRGLQTALCHPLHDILIHSTNVQYLAITAAGFRMQALRQRLS